MRRGTAFFLLVVVAWVAGSGASASYRPGELLFTFDDPQITESSGIVASSTQPDVYFTHNDSGDPARFFAVDSSGRTRTMYGVQGVRALDWEDIASGPGTFGGTSLFLGDIGDNGRIRGVVQVYEVAEPSVPEGQFGRSEAVRPAAVHLLVYPDGPRDAETLFVDPASGALGIVSKEPSGRSGVYVGMATGRGVSVLERVATIDLSALGTPPPPGHPFANSHLLATGGDVSPDGTRFVVRTYLEAFEWMVTAATLGQAVASTPARIALPSTGQGEAIGYASDGNALVTTSEGLFAPAHILRPE